MVALIIIKLHDSFVFALILHCSRNRKQISAYIPLNAHNVHGCVDQNWFVILFMFHQLYSPTFFFCCLIVIFSNH